MYWAPFLHLYQPPWQDMDVLRRINQECYEPLLLMMKRHENAKITLNVQGCLLDMLADLELDRTIHLLQELYDEGKIELVGSGKFHPILPIIPKSEIHRQVNLHKKTIKQYIDEDWEPKGFFPPEMAVSPNICNTVSNMGYQWMIMDGIANQNRWPNDYIQQSEHGLINLFRDTYISNEIAFKKIDAQQFVHKLETMYDDKNHPQYDHYVIVAMDGETFGHHIKYYETSFLGKVFSILEDRQTVEIKLISELVERSKQGKLFPVQNDATIRKSTWSTMGDDIASNVPYPLWTHPLNPLHKHEYRMLKNLYKLMDMLENHARSHLEKRNFKNYYNTARHFYDRALHSCWLWWSSMRPHWSPNLIYKGMDLVMKSAMNAQLALINVKVGEGDEYYGIIMDNMEKLMNAMITQESRGQHLRTFSID